MLNKPEGYVSTVSDQFDRPTVIDLLDEEIKTRIFPVGRLDYETAEKINALTMPTMQLAIYSAILLISWFGAKIIVNSNMTELTTGEITSLITYGIQISVGIN